MGEVNERKPSVVPVCSGGSGHPGSCSVWLSLGAFSSGLLAQHSRAAWAPLGVWYVAGTLGSRAAGWTCYSSHP